MRYQIPNRIRDFTPYEPIQGDFAVRLDANESFLTLQEKHTSIIQEKLSSMAWNRYPDPYATEATEAFAQYYQVSPNQVTAFNGSDEALALLCSALLNEEQILGVLSDDFSMYRQYAMTYGVPYAVFPKNEDLTIDVDKLIEWTKKENISALLFSNPCNPTSLGLSREQVKKLVSGVECYVFLDEAYMDFWDQTLLQDMEEYDNLLILKTCSKAIGLASIRMGFIVANKEMTRLLRAVKSPYNVNTLSQIVAQTVLSDGDYMDAAANKLVEQRKALQKGMEELAQEHSVLEKIYPSCTNFVFCKTVRSKEIWEALCKRSISIRCMGNYLRITAGSEEENRIVLTALSEVIKELSDHA